MKIKYASFSGKFYPANEEVLKNIISEMFNDVEVLKVSDSIISGIVPHAGIVYSGFTASHFYKLLNKQYKRIVIIGPSHYHYFEGFVLSSADFWETPFGKIQIDNDFNKILEDKFFIYRDDVHESEHSIEVQIPFIQYIYDDVKIVPIIMGKQDKSSIEYFLKKIKNIDIENTLFIASSDLYHGYDYKQANIVDNKTIKAISSNNYKIFYNYHIEQEITGDTPACGGGPIAIILGINEILNTKINILHHTTSSDITGDYGNYTVGYVSCSGNII